MEYKHLDQAERYHISRMIQNNIPVPDIAKNLGRHASSIYRELARSSGLRGYRPRQAQRKSDERAVNSNNARCIKDELWTKAVSMLQREFSPEQVSALLPLSHESIYLYIYRDKKNGSSLYTHLRCQKKRRKRYAGGRNKRGVIPHRIGIETVPLM